MTDWTTPRTWNIGELVTKAMMDTEIRDHFNAIWVGTTAGDLDYYVNSIRKGRIAKVTGGVLYGGASAPAYTAAGAKGSLFYNSAANTPAWLALGSNYSALRSNAVTGLPTWDVLIEKCVVYRNAAQSFSSGVADDIDWNAETYDDKGWHNNVTNPERITVLENGIYVPFVSIYWNKSSGGSGTFHMTAKVQINGADTPNKITVFESIDAATKRFTFGGVPMAMTASQYASVNFSQDSGGSGNLIGDASTGATASTFTLLRIG